ncbi:MAG: hypothetical protein ACYS4T_19010 [Planctomycetota bacterium]|jgi:uncharacterized protein HemX
MITESMTIQGLHVIFLALTPDERWGAARGSFDTASTTEGWLTVLAVAALIIAVGLLFWVFAKHRRSERCLNIKITELTITNVKLRQENNQKISELTATNVKLRQENNELTATNEKLRQENTELYQKQVEVLENIVDVEIPKKVNPSVKSSTNQSPE